jgi:hypothetical protein
VTNPTKEPRLNPLTEDQRCLVAKSIGIAERAAKSAAKRQRTHEHQLASAAHGGLMRAAESYERLGITMPWEDWASVHVNRALTNYFRSSFGRRLYREVTMSRAGSDDDSLNFMIDPKGENGQQMIDINDLLAKIPTSRHALLARGVVFDQQSKRAAGNDAGLSSGSGPVAWSKVSRSLKVWGDL